MGGLPAAVNHAKVAWLQGRAPLPCRYDVQAGSRYQSYQSSPPSGYGGSGSSAGFASDDAAAAVARRAPPSRTPPRTPPKPTATAAAASGAPRSPKVRCLPPVLHRASKPARASPT